MKFFTVSDRYISHLQKADSKVPDNYNGQRPFVGIVVEVNGVEYVAPLSSPKPHLEKIDSSKASIFKIYNRKPPNEFLGVINLNYMIPFLASEVTLLDIESLGDVRYKNLLNKQLEYIKIHKDDIEVRAVKLMSLVREKKQYHFVSISCDFDALEAAHNSFS